MSYILVIDDEQHICWLVAEALSPFGYLVQTSTNWREGLSLVKEKPPALILLDLKLPGVSGTALLGEIKRLVPEVPVVLMTGEVEVVENTAVAGCLTKPFNLEDLRRLVQRIMPFLPARP
uniref:Stage 0 sporulation protein A homolog n=1 Tax=Ammonifex degensii TaxID=42838 RepID=A0A7C2I0V7_9THEO